MSYIKFNDGVFSHEVVVSIVDKHTVRIVGAPKNLSGFKVYTDASVEIGDYSKYRYDYKNASLDADTFEYTDDNHKWVKPTYTTKFVASDGGVLEGRTEQIVDTYSQLNIPTPIPNENYEFTEWTPKIPKSGNIEQSEVYYANFVYVPTLEEIKGRKLEEMSSICTNTITQGQSIKMSSGDVDHFTYKQYDQTNIANAVNVASMVYQQTGQKISVPFYDSENVCRIYSYDDIMNIYISEQNFVTYNLTLCHQLQQMIKSLVTKEDVEAIVYSEDMLVGEYKKTFDTMLEQAKKVTDLIVGA